VAPPIDIPAEMQGKRIFLHIRGARLRAEVYLNQQLVGYSIMEELPFECDLTHAANPAAQTSSPSASPTPSAASTGSTAPTPSGDTSALYRSHGFGGLDRGMTISAHAQRTIAFGFRTFAPDRPRHQRPLPPQRPPHPHLHLHLLGLLGTQRPLPCA
jgi:hypothetical protein